MLVSGRVAQKLCRFGFKMGRSDAIRYIYIYNQMGC